LRNFLLSLKKADMVTAFCSQGFFDNMLNLNIPQDLLRAEQTDWCTKMGANPFVFYPLE